MCSILIADDDGALRQVIREFLQLWDSACQISEAANGAEAVDCARDTSPDIILMDIEMPKLDGISATRQITELGLGCKTIICTSYDHDTIWPKAKQAGAVDIIIKPFNLVDLGVKLEMILAK